MYCVYDAPERTRNFLEEMLRQSSADAQEKAAAKDQYLAGDYSTDDGLLRSLRFHVESPRSGCETWALLAMCGKSSVGWSA